METNKLEDTSAALLSFHYPHLFEGRAQSILILIFIFIEFSIDFGALFFG